MSECGKWHWLPINVKIITKCSYFKAAHCVLLRRAPVWLGLTRAVGELMNNTTQEKVQTERDGERRERNAPQPSLCLLSKLRAHSHIKHTHMLWCTIILQSARFTPFWTQCISPSARPACKPVAATVATLADACIVHGSIHPFSSSKIPHSALCSPATKHANANASACSFVQLLLRASGCVCVCSLVGTYYNIFMNRRWKGFFKTSVLYIETNKL